jgi:predicted transcriptional regulator
MKRLIISLKKSDEVLQDFKHAYHKAKMRKSKKPHYEISFDNRKDFDLFAKNIYILSKVLAFKPKSIYELAKLCGLDTSNLNKIILFFERIGAIRLKEQTIRGRSVRTPIVDYRRIEFDLAA